MSKRNRAKIVRDQGHLLFWREKGATSFHLRPDRLPEGFVWSDERGYRSEIPATPYVVEDDTRALFIEPLQGHRQPHVYVVGASPVIKIKGNETMQLELWCSGSPHITLRHYETPSIAGKISVRDKCTPTVDMKRMNQLMWLDTYDQSRTHVAYRHKAVINAHDTSYVRVEQESYSPDAYLSIGCRDQSRVDIPRWHGGDLRIDMRGERDNPGQSNVHIDARCVKPGSMLEVDARDAQMPYIWMSTDKTQRLPRMQYELSWYENVTFAADIQNQFMILLPGYQGHRFGVFDVNLAEVFDAVAPRGQKNVEAVSLVREFYKESWLQKEKPRPVRRNSTNIQRAERFILKW